MIFDSFVYCLECIEGAGGQPKSKSIQKPKRNATLEYGKPDKPYGPMGVSKNGGTPKSSKVGFSMTILDHPFWGFSIHGNPRLNHGHPWPTFFLVPFFGPWSVLWGRSGGYQPPPEMPMDLGTALGRWSWFQPWEESLMVDLEERSLKKIFEHRCCM